jgi:hypothetical protein
MSGKSKVDEQLPIESHQLGKQKIHTIHAAIEVPVYGAEKVSTSTQWQFQLCLN